MIRFPFLDFNYEFGYLYKRLQEICGRVIDSGRYIGGEEVTGFEYELGEFIGSPCVVGCSNGLDALRLIFRGYMELGLLRPGDEVITPSNNYIAGILALTDCGLKPVFVEPDPATYNLDWTLVEDALTNRTRAIMPVHLYGRACPVPAKWKEQFLIIEDNAQACGARVDGKYTGTLGHAAAFSFYPTKPLGALGDGGAVSTDNPELAEVIRALRNYGSDRQYHNIYRGLNCRLDPIQAAMLREKLRWVESDVRFRNLKVDIYNMAIENPLVVKPTIPADRRESMWHQYVIRVVGGRRDDFRKFLLEQGVETAVHYPTPAYLQPCYKEEYGHLSFPIAERLCDEVVSLPMSKATIVDDAAKISEIINYFE